MEASNEATLQGETNDPFNEQVNSNYGYATLQIPKDEEGFVVSFEKDDINGWKNFFDTYGIVVIRNIISNEEADRTADEVWHYLNKMLNVEKDDPSTWERWPWGKHLGILGSDLTLSQQACSNREHPNMYDFFCKLYGETELYTSVDRVGMMRPTKGIKFPDQEELVDKPDWKTKSEWLHWDMNPWTGKTSMYGWQGNKPEEPLNKGFDYLMVQGILGLYDCGPNDGGFHAVPGFHKHIQAWAKANEHLRERNTYPKIYDETTVQVPRSDPIRHDVQKMPLRKGSLLIWHSAIPHGTFPNDSNRFRLIQYMKMAPASYPHILPFYQSDSAFRPMYPFPEDVVLTELGKKIYGLKPWKPEEEKSRCVLM